MSGSGADDDPDAALAHTPDPAGPPRVAGAPGRTDPSHVAHTADPVTSSGTTEAGDLAADAQVVARLGPGSPWHRVEHRPEVTSTQDVALGLLRAGEPAGVVVVADAQTAGRGRAGRGWTDARLGAAGPANLAITFTAAMPLRGESLAPLAAGLAVADAYRAAGSDPALKWPNDVLLDGRKAAGILVERHAVGAGEVLLLGCGLDVDWRGVERTGDEQAWTSLAEAVAGPVDRGRLLADLLAALATLLDQATTDPAGLLAAYRRACATLGRQVEVDLLGGRRLRGTAVDVDPTGALVVEVEGRRHTVVAGDVHHLRPT